MCVAEHINSGLHLRVQGKQGFGRSIAAAHKDQGLQGLGRPSAAASTVRPNAAANAHTHTDTHVCLAEHLKVKG